MPASTRSAVQRKTESPTLSAGVGSRGDQEEEEEVEEHTSGEGDEDEILGSSSGDEDDDEEAVSRDVHERSRRARGGRHRCTGRGEVTGLLSELARSMTTLTDEVRTMRRSFNDLRLDFVGLQEDHRQLASRQDAANTALRQLQKPARLPQWLPSQAHLQAQPHALAQSRPAELQQQQPQQRRWQVSSDKTSVVPTSYGWNMCPQATAVVGEPPYQPAGATAAQAHRPSSYSSSTWIEQLIASSTSSFAVPMFSSSSSSSSSLCMSSSSSPSPSEQETFSFSEELSVLQTSFASLVWADMCRALPGLRNYAPGDLLRLHMPTYVLVSPPDPLLDRPPIGYANDAFVQLSGYSREELVGQLYDRLFTSSVRAHTALGRWVHNKSPMSIGPMLTSNALLRRRDGQLLRLHDQIRFFYDQRGTVAFAVVCINSWYQDTPASDETFAWRPLLSLTSSSLEDERGPEPLMR